MEEKKSGPAVGVLMLIVLGIVVFLFWTSWPRQGGVTDSKEVGEKAMLDSGGELAPVAIDEAAFEEWIKARVAKDEIGQIRLLRDGRVFTVKSGMQVQVIESRLASRKIRVLEGDHFGEAGWTPKEYVR